MTMETQVRDNIMYDYRSSAPRNWMPETQSHNRLDIIADSAFCKLQANAPQGRCN